MASGHMNRVKRPDTWLHRPMLQNVKKVLANPEPSTHDPTRTSRVDVGQIWLSCNYRSRVRSKVLDFPLSHRRG
jgi:hypothetical protein